MTNRALVLGALASWSGPCTIRSALQSEDTEVMVRGLRSLGFGVEHCWNSHEPSIAIHPITRAPTNPDSQSWIPATRATIDVANSGTTMRFLAALAALGRGVYRLDGSPRMRERPMSDLVAALNQLGVAASSELNNGCPPVRIASEGLFPGQVTIRGDVSSQFLSALALVCPLAQGPITIHLDGHLVSAPYLDMTVNMVRQAGGSIEWKGSQTLWTPGRQHYSVSEFRIEPDASAASYFFGAAAITGGEIEVVGLSSHSLQGDTRFIDILAQMGCAAEERPGSLYLRGGPLRAVDVDMNAISDCVPTLAAVACFADGPTTIRGVAHLRHKESNRITALVTELNRLGAKAVGASDGLRIMPGPLRGATIETYDDHRIAMSMALLGLRVPGVRISNPGCVAKTYPRFFDDLQLLYD